MRMERVLRTPITTMCLDDARNESCKRLTNHQIITSFSKQHGTNQQTFDVGDYVNVRNYKTPNKPGSTPGVVVRKRESTVYDVKTGHRVQRRNTNQLRPRQNADDADLLNMFWRSTCRGTTRKSSRPSHDN